MITTEELQTYLESAQAALNGPWQVVMARNDDGVTSYMVREHTHTSVVVERDQYWDDNYEPKTDADGYWLPDDKMDALPHRTGNATFIAASRTIGPEAAREVIKLRERIAQLEAERK